MDTSRIKSIAVLGYYFNRHLIRSLIPGKEADQAELFLSYFRDDRIASFTEAEHEALAAFEGCVACGLCPSRCRVMEHAPGRFQGPMHIAVSASRSHPDFVNDLDNILLCAACGQCEPICPSRVPVSRIASTMRAMIWRVLPESMPAAYQKAREDLENHGSIYGPEPEHDSKINGGAKVALVLGPLLRQDPARSNNILEVLEKLGCKAGLVEEGTIGGVAESLGLVPDTDWVTKLAQSTAGTVIVADPEVWTSLVNDERLEGRQVKFLLETIAEKWPSGLSLCDVVEGVATVHDTWPLARSSSLWRLSREFFDQGKVELVEMEDHGDESPPLGWEGGIELVDPDLAAALARARIADAKAAGAGNIITLSPADTRTLETAGVDNGLSVSYLFDIIHRILC